MGVWGHERVTSYGEEIKLDGETGGNGKPRGDGAGGNNRTRNLWGIGICGGIIRKIC